MNKAISDLIYGGVLKTDSIIDAFANISRDEFVSSKLRMSGMTHSDICIPTGHGFITPSVSTIARIFESILPQRNDNVLVVGEIDGWVTTLLSYIVGPNGSVLTVTRVRRIEKFLKEKSKDFSFLISNNNYSVHTVNYTKMKSCCAILEDKKFDKIIVLEKFLVENCDISKSLNKGGVYVVFVDDNVIDFSKVKKK